MIDLSITVKKNQFFFLCIVIYWVGWVGHIMERDGQEGEGEKKKKRQKLMRETEGQ